MSSYDILTSQPDSPLIAPGLPKAPGAVPGFRLPSVNLSDAFRAIIVPGNNTNMAGYTLSGFDYLDVVSVSATVDTFNAGGSSQVTLSMLEQSGVTIAQNRTGAALPAGLLGEVTFAALLPDTSTLPPPLSPDFIQTGMPIVVLQPQNTIQVSTVDPLAIVLEVRLWVWNANVRAGDLGIPPRIRVPVG